jgi:hypothetical protein
MNEIFKKLIASFTNDEKRIFCKKIIFFFGVITAIVLGYHFAKSDNVIGLVTLWLGFVLLCLGIITMQQVINFKNGSNKE